MVSDLFLGIDVGTSGVRASVMDAEGTVFAHVRVPCDFSVKTSHREHIEQDAELWWKATTSAIQKALSELKAQGLPATSIKALSLASTSGTVVAADRNGKPLAPAILYSDGRANEEAKVASEVGSNHCRKLGYKFGASFALPKILWIKKHLPEVYRATTYFLSPTDFLLGRLTGRIGFEDTSNALKFGFDLIDFRWPGFLEDLGLDGGKFPQVVKTGEMLGETHDFFEKETGLPSGVHVVAGATDGTAGLFSSGATEPGDFNTTIGTTLVVKGIATKLVVDPSGRIYSHYHPEGWWLPGGASTSGAEYLSKNFTHEEIAKPIENLEEILGGNVFVYPLARVGERFPFVNPRSRGFVEPAHPKRQRHLAASLEGIAFLERWCYEVLVELGTEAGGKIFSSGGASESQILSRLRSTISGKEVLVPSLAETSVGAAVISASGTFYKNISEATRKMVRIERVFYPEGALVGRFNRKYEAWRSVCEQKGCG